MTLLNILSCRKKALLNLLSCQKLLPSISSLVQNDSRHPLTPMNLLTYPNRPTPLNLLTLKCVPKSPTKSHRKSPKKGEL